VGTDNAFFPVVVMTMCVWFGSFALSTLRDLIAPPDGFGWMTAARLLYAVLGGVCCIPIYALLDRARRFGLGTRAVSALPLIALIAIGYTQATFLAQDFVAARLIRGSQIPAQSAAATFYNTVYWALFFVVSAALYLAIRFSQAVAQQAVIAQRLQSLAHDAQIRALRYQVDPHFLFNALNAISALIVTDRAPHADLMVRRLSRFFRASLALDPEIDISLHQEIELQQAYLAIEQSRFPDLSVHFDTDRQAADARVPALILQPLMENAMKHSVARIDGASNVSVAAHRTDDQVIISVVSDFPARARGSRDVGTGTGLANVRSRLAGRFGGRAALTVDDVGAFRVDITIPYEPMP
jgi:hypothetical protein